VKAKDVPPMQKALADLSPYFQIFYDAFESGDDHSKDFFKRMNASHDPWLHAHLIRHWVKLYFIQHNVDAQEYEAEHLANSGLQLSVLPWFIRIRKSLHGAVPLPGSRKQRNYYQQVLPQEFGEMHNLLLLWNATPTGDFKGLSLIYPFSAELVRWRAEIPHPAQSASIMTTYQSAFDDLGDLDIEPLEEGEDDLEAEG